MDAARVVEVLALGRAFVEVSWVQYHYGETAEGRIIDPFDAAAVRFCAIGAIERAAFELTDGPAKQVARQRRQKAYQAQRLLVQTLGEDAGLGDPVERWQDEPGRRKREVLALFDRAAAVAGKG